MVKYDVKLNIEINNFTIRNNGHMLIVDSAVAPSC